MTRYPKILLIAGTGRNSGKTTLAVRVIEKFAKHHDLVAVKISPHFHMGTPGLRQVIKKGTFNIYREEEKTGDKDSAKMFAAGARHVFYVEVLDLHLREAFESLLLQIPASSPVVVESPALGNVIVPAVFLIVDHPQTLYKKADVLAGRTKADRFINSSLDDLDAVVARLEYNASGWHFMPD